MLRSIPLLRLAAACFLSIAAQSATAAPVAFSFTGSVNYMTRYNLADNSVDRVTSSMFPGALVEEHDIFTGAFYYDDTAPLGPLQQEQPEGGTFLRYMAPQESSGLTLASTRNGVGYTSQSGSEFFVSDMYFGDNVAMFNYSEDRQFVKHGGIFLYGPAGVLQPGRVPGSSQVMDFSAASFFINWVDIATGNQLQVMGLINELTPTTPNQVPEPLTPALFGLAAAMAIVAGRKRARNNG